MCIELLLRYALLFSFGYAVQAGPIEDLYEGSACSLAGGASGICTKLPECPYWVKEVREGRKSWGATGRCGFENFTEIVCCPKNNTKNEDMRPAEIACRQFENDVANNNFDKKVDGVRFHILGGTEAEPAEFPYAVALGYENKNEYGQRIKYTCGGTLISTSYVLTAAHCVSNVQGDVPVEVRLGNEDLTNNDPNVQQITINNIISHPRFKRTTNYNDIALLKLKTPVRMSNSVRPCCIHTKSISSTGLTSNQSLIVIGWGSTDFDNDGSEKLMKTPSLSLIDNDKCAPHYNGFLKLPHGLGKNMLCAQDANLTRRADACQGDSGGPLLLLSEDKQAQIIGITSFGQACGNPVPAVYTSVQPYLDWIEKQVWPDLN
ncbi:hypothetical protein KM043_006714 [Ampulex compressa]|uniref:chymotrypsin n=1 Tax=Ampulex compressa TaxID=860918 RepID=A0A1W6EW85_AMPCP|nr:serine protease persephone-like protein [Ampulex compressa]KAG7190631.1 hypothetical protein KM043_006714 [Ampulex compressa]